jgi:hypothetical protein
LISLGLPACLIEKGMYDFKFKQFEHAQVKVEQATGVGRKLCMKNNSDSFENDHH